MEEPVMGAAVTDKNIRQLLEEMATITPSEYDTSNWCHLPFWFKVTNEKIIAYHEDQLPPEIKRQLDEYGLLKQKAPNEQGSL